MFKWELPEAAPIALWQISGSAADISTFSDHGSSRNLPASFRFLLTVLLKAGHLAIFV